MTENNAAQPNSCKELPCLLQIDSREIFGEAHYSALFRVIEGCADLHVASELLRSQVEN